MVQEISLKAAPRIQLIESGESERSDCGGICKCSEYIGMVVWFDDAWSLRSEKETNLRSIFLSCRTAHFVPFPFGLVGGGGRMEQVGMQVGGCWEFNLGLMQLCLCYADGYGPQDIGCSFTFIIALIS